jgi:hypothetical protein
MRFRELAQPYTGEAIAALADIMRNSKSDQALALAADKLLDRGYGKPSQPLAGDKENPLEFVIGDARRIVEAKLAAMSARYLRAFRLRIAAAPRSPAPKKESVKGSGTPVVLTAEKSAA